MLVAVLADRSWPQPFCSVSSICLIKSHTVLLFHFRYGNSQIIVNALNPFSNHKAFIKNLSLFVKGALFVNINYVTNDAATFAKNI